MLADRLHYFFERAVTQLDDRVLYLGAGLLRHAASFGKLIRAQNMLLDENVSEIAAPFGHGIYLPGVGHT